MTKGELNIAVADLQTKVNRIDSAFEKAQWTAAKAVERKYKKQMHELLVACGDDGAPLYTAEVISCVEFPQFYEVEDLSDAEATELDGDH